MGATMTDDEATVFERACDEARRLLWAQWARLDRSGLSDPVTLEQKTRARLLAESFEGQYPGPAKPPEA